MDTSGISNTQVRAATVTTDAVATTRTSAPPAPSARPQAATATRSDRPASISPTDVATVKQAVAEANQEMKSLNQSINFSYEKRLNILVVKVIDSSTQQVVKQFPSKDFIEQRLSTSKFIGTLLNKRG